MIPLCIIGALLLVLLLLLLAPIRLEVAFRQEFSAQVRYLFLCFPLAPSPEPLEEPSPSQPPVQEGKPASSPSFLQKLRVLLRREGLSGFLQTLQEVAQQVKTASAHLLKRIKLKRFDLYICLGGKEDAAAAAIQYGQVCAAAYGASGALLQLFPCRKKSVSVDLDYSHQEHQVDFSATISIRVLFLLIEGLILLYRVLPFFKKLQAAEDHIERISRPRKQGETK